MFCDYGAGMPVLPHLMLNPAFTLHSQTFGSVFDSALIGVDMVCCGIVSRSEEFEGCAVSRLPLAQNSQFDWRQLFWSFIDIPSSAV